MPGIFLTPTVSTGSLFPCPTGCWRLWGYVGGDVQVGYGFTVSTVLSSSCRLPCALLLCVPSAAFLSASLCLDGSLPANERAQFPVRPLGQRPTSPDHSVRTVVRDRQDRIQCSLRQPCSRARTSSATSSDRRVDATKGPLGGFKEISRPCGWDRPVYCCSSWRAEHKKCSRGNCAGGLVVMVPLPRQMCSILQQFL